MLFKQLPMCWTETAAKWAALNVGCVCVYRELLKCHSRSVGESGAQSTDWLLAGARLWGPDTELVLWMLLPKLVPSCRRLMWRITAVALKACCENRVMTDKCKAKEEDYHRMVLLFSILCCDYFLCSPSICFWQSFSASVGWLIHVCSCRAQCLQQSWKWEASPFRSCQWHFTHTNTASPKLFIFAFVRLRKTARGRFPISSFIFILLKHLWLMAGCFSHCNTFCHIHHNISVWKLVNETYFSPLYLLVVSQTALFVSEWPPAQDPEGPLLAHRPIHIGHLSWRQQPTH